MGSKKQSEKSSMNEDLSIAGTVATRGESILCDGIPKHVWFALARDFALQEAGEDGDEWKIVAERINVLACNEIIAMRHRAAFESALEFVRTGRRHG